MTHTAEPILPLTFGPARLTRSAVTASQQTRMLRAMMEAASEKGYANTVVADVVSRAGVSRKTFYEHYADKEACFLAAYDACVDLLIERIDAAIVEAPAAAEGVRTLLGTYLDALAADPGAASLYLVEVGAAGPTALVRRRGVQARFAERFTALRDRWEPAPTLPLDPLHAEALVGAISAMVSHRVAAGQAAALPALREPLVALAMTLLDVPTP